MARRKATITQTEIERVLRAASRMNGGVAMTVRLLPDGSLVAVPLTSVAPAVDAPDKPEIDEAFTLY